jgi:hypothetical protein
MYWTLVTNKLIRIVRLILQETENEDGINNKISKKFKVKGGLRQGDALSSILYSLI